MTTIIREGIEPRKNRVGNLRLIQPFPLRIEANRHGPHAPMRVGSDTGSRKGDYSPNTMVDPNEYLVRIGAHIFASNYPREKKTDWWKDMVDLFKFYQFLIKMADLSAGAIFVDDTIFTNGESQNYILVTEWPPDGRTNMGGRYGGYWSVFRAVTDGPVDEVSFARITEKVSSGELYPYAGQKRANQTDPRNQDQRVWPRGTRLPYDLTKLDRIKQILSEMDWSDRDSSTAAGDYDDGNHIDSRFGAAALGYMHLPASLTTFHLDSLVFPAMWPICTARVGNEIRPLAPGDMSFRYRWIGVDPLSYADGEGDGDAAATARSVHGVNLGIWIRLENTSGGTLNMRGMVPLRSFNFHMKAMRFGSEEENDVIGTSEEYNDHWDNFWFHADFGG